MFVLSGERERAVTSAFSGSMKRYRAWRSKWKTEDRAAETGVRRAAAGTQQLDAGRPSGRCGQLSGQDH